MRRWIQACGGPAILTVVGFVLLALVDQLEYGTHLERHRLSVLYASQAAFNIGIVWSLHSLWVQIKRHLVQRKS